MKDIFKNKAFFGIVIGVIVAVYSACQFEEELPKITEYPDITVSDYSPKSGKPNELVVITGTNFGDYPQAVTVSFGGVASQVIDTVYNEEIRVRVPYGAVTGEVTVKVWTNEAGFDEDFVVLAGAKITSIDPAAGSAGEIITITGENFGTEMSDVEVRFASTSDAGYSVAELISVADTEIQAVIPVGVTGAITLVVQPETITGPQFVYPFVGIDETFDNGDGGWEPQQGGTSSVADGMLSVEFVGGKQSDLKFNQSILIDGGSFPYVAMKMTRLGDFDLSLETDLGVFGGDVNQYGGILSGDVYYWDLRSAPFIDDSDVETTIPVDEKTLVSDFRFNITARSSETGYSVDFIRSFETLDNLKAYIAENTPVGKYYFEFDEEVLTATTDADKIRCEFTDHKMAYHQTGSKMVLTFAEARMDFFRMYKNGKPATSGKLEGDPQYVPNWVYSKEYPIYAMKVDLPDGVVPFTKWTKLVPEPSFPGFAANNFAGTALDGGVFYWDGRDFIENNASFDVASGLTYWDSFGFGASNVTASLIGTDWSCDWFMTFKSLEELQAYMENH
ncbi:DUF4979 domain-containing protein [Reichenbachiella agarivorans]|uniref:DUF4979 domain-containing protein n=1 Tax=Reichenbachiella agarivorans TaxID=2979464 RepID=A0ABY6CQ18_9BACT|nr:IPT/TIG domain-containing protein [Reichenbachiella agarivorans]UXP32621.1 DUF4979 domain-containing protein [Reichenbachiella agarivorans]